MKKLTGTTLTPTTADAFIARKAGCDDDDRVAPGGGGGSGNGAMTRVDHASPATPAVDVHVGGSETELADETVPRRHLSPGGGAPGALTIETTASPWQVAPVLPN